MRRRTRRLIDHRQHVDGTLVHLPAGTVHHFRFGAEGGKMIEITGKGGSATKLFTALDREIAPGPPDIPAVIGVLQRHGVNVAAA